MADAHSRLPHDVVLFSTADWKTPYWTNKQHTARHLAHAGFRVLYVESPGLRPPTINGRDLRRILRRLRDGLRRPLQVEPGLWVLSPLGIPFKHHWPVVRAFNQGLLRWRIRRFLRAHRCEPPLVWTYHPFVLETLQGLPHGPIVYHCVDDLSAVPGIDLAAFNAEEERLLDAAKVVFTTSEALQAKCASRNPHTHFLPNVADATHFGKALEPGPVPAEIDAIPRPRIGYIGVLSDFKVDFGLVLAAARRRGDWHWIFIGEEREGQRSPLVEKLRSLGNVHFLGYRAYSSLPDYLRGLDVATLPTLLNDYTRSMFPMKYFEYLAAGLRIVATPLDFTRTFRAGMEVAADAASFAAAIDRQLRRGKLTAGETLEALGENTWEKRMQRMLTQLEVPACFLGHSTMSSNHFQRAIF